MNLSHKKQRMLRGFLLPCPDALQNIHFLEMWHPESLVASADDNTLPINVQGITLPRLMRYMCQDWLRQFGRPQQRTLKVTPQNQRLYRNYMHPEILETEGLRDLHRADLTLGKYTYRLIEEVFYTGVHENLLPLELAEWL